MTNSELLYSDPLSAAAAAAKEITERTGVASHDVALVMGSGWVSAVDALGTPAYECNAEDITGFLPPTVEGHSGKVRSYEIESNGKKVYNSLAIVNLIVLVLNLASTFAGTLLSSF